MAMTKVSFRFGKPILAFWCDATELLNAFKVPLRVFEIKTDVPEKALTVSNIEAI